MSRIAMPKRWRARLCLCALSLLGACSTIVPVPSAPPTTPAAADAAWARVLDRFVDARGEVDFAALAADRADLDRYVRHVAETPPASTRDDDARLADLINAYNALSMFNVIELGIPATHAGFNKVSFFYLRKLTIGGRSLSLYAFENDVIRPFARSRRDPRVHFALNCSAVACPVLPRRPFTGAELDAELEAAAVAFFARPENLRVDDATRTVWLNEILDFYTEDFVPVPAPSLIAYVNRYASRPVPADYRVRFTPYDWTIANQRRAR
jgi:Protein of unknown function, DUF547